LAQKQGSKLRERDPRRGVSSPAGLVSPVVMADARVPGLGPLRRDAERVGLPPDRSRQVERWSVEAVEWLLRSSPMGRGSKSIRRWRKDRKRKKAERKKRKLAAADQRRSSRRQRSG
jgi:hypothetical protein